MMDKAFKETEEQVEVESMAKEFEQTKVKEAANEMFDQMMSDPDPRFQASKFLNFLGQLKSGELKIVG